MSNFNYKYPAVPVHSHTQRLVVSKKEINFFRIPYVFLLLILFFFSRFTFAQREKIDNLKKALPSLHDSARVDCLNTIFRTYYWLGIDSFKYYADPAYEESIKINYIHGIAEAVNNKAIMELLRGNYPNDDGIGRKKASELKSKSVSFHKSMGMRITADRIAILQQKK